MDRKYTVYMHINKSNNKKYIGITGQDAERRWREDGSGYKGNRYFSNSIKKHGWDNFKHIVLAGGLTKKEAEAREIELISQYNTTDRSKGYNIANGGNANGMHSEETRKLMSKKAKQRKPDYNKLKTMWDNNRNREYTDEHKRNISKALTGKKLSKEHVKAISEAHKGYVMPEKQKEKIRMSCMKTFSDPEKRREKSIRAKNNPAVIAHLRKLARGRIKVNEKIILTNTREVFKNHLSVEKYSVQPNKILKNCQNEISSAGKDEQGNPLIWKFLKEFDEKKDYQRERKETVSASHSRAKYRPVVCVTTNERFESQKQAKEKYNIKGSGISEVCSGKRKHAGTLGDGTKLKWEYA